mgnify:CR=1 FL=1|tara:strand:+ start:3907 stop:4230 length:324 start_codon:yes stop_codon:yes gene_type:complete
MLEIKSGNLRPLRAGDRILIEDLGEGMVKVSAVDLNSSHLHLSKETDAVLLTSTGPFYGREAMIELMAAAANLNVAYIGRSRTGKELFELREPIGERGSGVILPLGP